MTYYLKTKAGNVLPASVWKCRIQGCESEMLCPGDAAPTDAARELGWKRLDTLETPSYNKTGFRFWGFICHLHEVNHE